MINSNTGLLRKAFRVSSEKKFVKIIAPYFVLFIVLSFIVYFLDLTVIELVLGLLFFPILMTSLRSYEEKSAFKLPKSSILLKKFWKLLIVNVIVQVIIILGFIFLFVPGLIFWKRYIYVSVISEQEQLGPLESMKRSVEVSKSNGWRVLSREVLIAILSILCLLVPILLAGIAGDGVYLLICIPLLLFIAWIQYVVLGTLLFYGYKEATK